MGETGGRGRDEEEPVRGRRKERAGKRGNCLWWLMIPVGYLFISAGRRLKADKAWDQSVVIIKSRKNVRTNHKPVHERAGWETCSCVVWMHLSRKGEKLPAFTCCSYWSWALVMHTCCVFLESNSVFLSVSAQARNVSLCDPQSADPSLQTAPQFQQFINSRKHKHLPLSEVREFRDPLVSPFNCVSVICVLTHFVQSLLLLFPLRLFMCAHRREGRCALPTSGFHILHGHMEEKEASGTEPFCSI